MANGAGFNSALPSKQWGDHVQTDVRGVPLTGRMLVLMRWAMSSPPHAGGLPVTNIRDGEGYASWMANRHQSFPLCPACCESQNAMQQVLVFRT